MTGFKFKYAANVSSCSLCPPAGHKTPNCIAYRWVYCTTNSTVDDSISFIPQGIKDPKRILKERKDENKCDLYSLSFFDTEPNAINRFNFIKGNIGLNASKALGTHVAKGQLSAAHGVIGSANNIGHFELYEAESTIWSPSGFSVTGTL